MKCDRTVLTYNHLSKIINCIQKLGYEINDFEFSTEQSQSYFEGVQNPTAVIYVFRTSTRIEMSYIVGRNTDFTTWICTDLKQGVFEKFDKYSQNEQFLKAS